LRVLASVNSKKMGDKVPTLSRAEPLRDEIERVVVAAPIVKRAAQAVVERVDVDEVEAAANLHLVAAVQSHVVHEPEHASARGSGEAQGRDIQMAEHLGGQTLLRSEFSISSTR
jgi:hypothetical protein